jgi:nitric oxide reductase subunit C
LVEKQLQFVPPTLRSRRLSWPDLTNVYANRNEDYLKAMLNSGVKAMPKFNFNSKEKEALVQFLKKSIKRVFIPILKPN